MIHKIIKTINGNWLTVEKNDIIIDFIIVSYIKIKKLTAICSQLSIVASQLFVIGIAIVVSKILQLLSYVQSNIPSYFFKVRLILSVPNP